MRLLKALALAVVTFVLGALSMFILAITAVSIAGHFGPDAAAAVTLSIITIGFLTVGFYLTDYFKED